MEGKAKVCTRGPLPNPCNIHTTSWKTHPLDKDDFWGKLTLGSSHSTHIDSEQNENFKNFSEIVEHLTAFIHDAAAEFIPRVIRGRKLKLLTWWNKECEEANTLLKRRRKKCRWNRLVQYWLHYGRIREETMDFCNRKNQPWSLNLGLWIWSRVVPHENSLGESWINERKMQ